jgi:hypothetical protein
MGVADDLTLLQTYFKFYSSPRLPDLANLSAYIPLAIAKYQQKFTFNHGA